MTMHAKIYFDEDCCYTAEIPALQGCVAQGVTMDQVKDNVKIAVHDWFEAMEQKHHLDTSEFSNMCFDDTIKCDVKLHIKVIEDIDGTYTAVVPALENCTAQGLTQDEAIGNLKVALVQWIQLSELKSGVDFNELTDITL